MNEGRFNLDKHDPRIETLNAALDVIGKTSNLHQLAALALAVRVCAPCSDKAEDRVAAAIDTILNAISVNWEPGIEKYQLSRAIETLALLIDNNRASKGVDAALNACSTEDFECRYSLECIIEKLAQLIDRDRATNAINSSLDAVGKSKCYVPLPFRVNEYLYPGVLKSEF